MHVRTINSLIMFRRKYFPSSNRLERAIDSGNEAMVLRLLKEGASSKGLFISCAHRFSHNLEVVRAVLVGGAKPDEVQQPGNVGGMHVAASKPKDSGFQLVEFLVQEYPTCVEKEDNGGATPLAWALAYGNIKCATLLLRWGAHVGSHYPIKNLKGCEIEHLVCHGMLSSLKWSEMKQINALHVAVGSRLTGDRMSSLLVQLLSKEGCPVNVAEDTVSPLCIAALRGRSETVDALLKAGADPHPEKCFSYPYRTQYQVKFPIEWASYASDGAPTTVIQSLLRAGAQPTPPCLFAATNRGDAESVLVLLKSGLDPNHVSPVGAHYPDTEPLDTCLHLCAKKGDCVAVGRLLLQYGANPRMKDQRGKEPFDLTASFSTRRMLLVWAAPKGSDTLLWLAAKIIHRQHVPYVQAVPSYLKAALDAVGRPGIFGVETVHSPKDMLRRKP